MMSKAISYDYDAKGNIVLPEGAPFDGKNYLVKFAAGWCEARWEPHEPRNDDGFCWVLLDDSAPQQELDDAKEWCELPGVQFDVVKEALVLAEDVLSRWPFSTEIWPNGVHPQTGITKIRKAIEACK